MRDNLDNVKLVMRSMERHLGCGDSHGAAWGHRWLVVGPQEDVPCQRLGETEVLKCRKQAACWLDTFVWEAQGRTFFFFGRGELCETSEMSSKFNGSFFLPWRKMMVAALVAFMARLEVLCAEVPALPRRRGIWCQWITQHCLVIDKVAPEDRWNPPHVLGPRAEVNEKPISHWPTTCGWSLFAHSFRSRRGSEDSWEISSCFAHLFLDLITEDHKVRVKAHRDSQNALCREGAPGAWCFAISRQKTTQFRHLLLVKPLCVLQVLYRPVGCHPLPRVEIIVDVMTLYMKEARVEREDALGLWNY